MSNLSDLKAAGGSGKSIDLVASGALANGDKVILRSDGKVEVVASTSYSQSIPESSGLGTAAYDYDSSYMHMATDPHDSSKFVITWTPNNSTHTSYYPRMVIGTVSGTTITFGTIYTIVSAGGFHPEPQYDPNTSGKIVVTWIDMNTDDMKVVCATVASNGTITFGTVATPLGSTNASLPQLAFDPSTTGKFAIAYIGLAGVGRVIVGTLSGTTLSFGSPVNFASYNISTNTYDNNNQPLDLQFDPNTAGKFVIAYLKQSNNYGYAIAGTVSGTTPSLGSEVAYNSSACGTVTLGISKKRTDKFIVGYMRSDHIVECRVGTFTGTALGFGSAVNVSGTSTYSGKTGALSFDHNSYKFIYQYTGKSINASVSWTPLLRVGELDASDGVTFNTVIELYGGTYMNTDHYGIQFLGGTGNFGEFVWIYKNDFNPRKIYCHLGQIATANTNITATNFLGISEGAFADTATATVMLRGGITTTQSGLTIGSTYYVQADGTLSTTADSPSVVAGQAISATTLLIEGES
jgi:hypothetical protein